MHFCLGWLLLLPVSAAILVAVKVVDACIKAGGLARPFGVLVSFLVGGLCIVGGYLIGPIAGWFIMALGVAIIFIGTWRSLTVTREQVLLEELKKRTKASEDEEQESQYLPEHSDWERFKDWIMGRPPPKEDDDED